MSRRADCGRAFARRGEPQFLRAANPRADASPGPMIFPAFHFSTAPTIGFGEVAPPPRRASRSERRMNWASDIARIIATAGKRLKYERAITRPAFAAFHSPVVRAAVMMRGQIK